MQPRPGERSAPHSLVLTVRTSPDKSLSFKGPQHAAEITGVNSQATTKLANFGTVVHRVSSLARKEKRTPSAHSMHGEASIHELIGRKLDDRHFTGQSSVAMAVGVILL